MVAVRLCGFAKDKPRLIQRVACANGLALLARHKRAFAAVVLLSAVGTDAVVLRVVPNAAALPAEGAGGCGGNNAAAMLPIANNAAMVK